MNYISISFTSELEVLGYKEHQLVQPEFQNFAVDFCLSPQN